MLTPEIQNLFETTTLGRYLPGASFQLFLGGGQIIFPSLYSMPPDYVKNLEKKQHFHMY